MEMIFVDTVFLTGIVTGTMAFILNRNAKAKAWFDKKTPTEKQDWIVGFIVASALVIFAFDCVDLLNTTLTCQPKDIVDLLYAIVFGGTVNQSAHLLSKRAEG